MNEISASLLWSSISMNLTPTPQSSSRRCIEFYVNDLSFDPDWMTEFGHVQKEFCNLVNRMMPFCPDEHALPAHVLGVFVNKLGVGLIGIHLR